MSDLLDGPVIAGPRIAAADRPADGPAEIEDTPGSRLPAEWLHDSPQGRTAGRKRLRLIMAWELFCSVHAGHATAVGGNTDKARQWSWDQADKFLADTDRTPPPAQPATSAAVAVTGGPHTSDCVKPAAEHLPLTRNDHSYLLWLSNFDAVPPSAVCPPLGPEMSAKCRRRLMSLGYVSACRWEDSHGFGITAAGREVVRGQSFDVLKLGPQGDAA